MKYSLILPTLPERKGLLFDALKSVFVQQIPIENLILVVDQLPNQVDLQEYTHILTKLIAEHKDNFWLSNMQFRICQPTIQHNLCDSLNTGIDVLAKIEGNLHNHFVCFLDDDDIWDEKYLIEIDNTMQSLSQPDVVVGSINRLDTNHPKGKMTTVLQKDLISRQFFIGNPGIQCSNLCIRLATLIQIKGFDIDVPSYSDRDICLSLIQHGAKFQIAKHAVIHHNTLHPMPRVSDANSSKKITGFEHFYGKWHNQFNENIQMLSKKRVKELFGLFNQDATDKLQVLIGVISIDPELLNRLLNSLKHLNLEKFAVDVIVLANSLDFQLQSIDLKQINIKVLKHSSDKVLEIPEARTYIQKHIFEYCQVKNNAPLVWLLDEDTLVDSEANDYLPEIISQRENKIDIIIGSIKTDSANAASSGLQIQISDLVNNLVWLDGLGNERIPDRVRENNNLRTTYPDYYYDYASGSSQHLDETYWIEPATDNETAQQAKLRILQNLPHIAAGHTFFRPLKIDAEYREESLHRGPNTFILNLDCLQMRQPLINIDDSTSRRSDMIWALMQKKLLKRKIIKVGFSVEHRRKPSFKELTLEKTINEHIGSIIFNALKEYLQIDSNMSLATSIANQVVQKQIKLKNSFEKIPLLLNELEKFPGTNIQPFCETINAFYNKLNLLEIIKQMNKLASNSQMILDVLWNNCLIENQCTLTNKFGNLRQYSLVEGLEGIKIISTHPLESFDKSESLLVRIHSSCINSETFFADDCDCASELESSFQKITSNPKGGVIFHLDQEGRGHGYNRKIDIVGQMQRSKINTYVACENLGLEHDIRDYSVVTTILKLLGFKTLNLLTNNIKKTRALRKAGFNVNQSPILGTYSHNNLTYLLSKQQNVHSDLIITAEMLNLASKPFDSDDNPVEFYEKEEIPFGCFSNVSLQHPISIAGQAWFSSEHYYQAQKFYLHQDIYSQIKQANSPIVAKSIARKYSAMVDSKWNEKKLLFMFNALHAKFTQFSELQELLIKTGNRYIVEKATDDYYWGIGDDYSGDNMLGKLLMHLRTLLTYK